MSDLDRFELFTHVAQIGSLTKSTKNLQLTKASLSKHIKKLEADLRVDLFTRTGQRLQLTEQGEILLQQCLRLKKEIEDTRAICEDFHAIPKGTLYVVVRDLFAERLIYPWLHQFMQKYPELEIIVDIRECLPDFENEQVDLALGFSTPAPDNLMQRRIATTRYVMCATAGYLKKHGTPNSLNDLTTHCYIRHRTRSRLCKTHLKKGYEIELKTTLSLNSMIGMLECARQGVGIVQLPFNVVEKYLQSGELIEVLTEYQAPEAFVYYCYPKFRHTQPKVRCFIDFFLKNRFFEK